jgi:RNA polymerase sigma-70 factor (ECF subfamily)
VPPIRTAGSKNSIFGQQLFRFHSVYIVEVKNVNSSANFEYLQYVAGTVDRKAALSELMEAYGNDVWNFAFALTRSAEQADSVTQEAFVRAYRSLRLFRGEASVKAWLLALTRSAARTPKKPALLRRISQPGKTSVAAASDSDGLNDSWRSVMALPAKFREVLILSAHHRLTLAEIAYVLDISEQSAKLTLHEARLKALGTEGR